MPYNKKQHNKYCRLKTLQKYNINHTQLFKLIYNYKHKTTKFYETFWKKKVLFSNKLAYLAGLIDGEGCLKIENHGTIRLIIGMTDRKAIYWIYQTFGGNIGIDKTKKGKNFYVWRMNQGKDLFYLLLLVMPFLITKKQIIYDSFKKIVNKFYSLEHTFFPFNISIRKG